MPSGVDFNPRRGRRQRLDDINVTDGQMLFTIDTGGLYIDYKDERGALERGQVSASKLVKAERNVGGTVITSTLEFDQVANKLDRITPKKTEAGYDMTGNIVEIGPNGVLLDTGMKKEDIGMGSQLIFAETVLESTDWTATTKSQRVPVPNVLEDSIVLVSPKFPQESMKYNIYCSAQEDEFLTFTYIDAQPTQDITFNIMILGKSASEEDQTRFVESAYLNPDGWTDNTQRYYTNAQVLKESSVVTVSPINVLAAMPYNIYAYDQGNGYIDFRCEQVPEESIGFYLLIENFN